MTSPLQSHIVGSQNQTTKTEAELPVTISQPRSSNKRARLSRANRLGLYLYTLAHFQTEDAQRQYVAYFQGRLNLEEVQKAMKFMHQLTTSPKIRARIQGQGFKFEIPFWRARPVHREQRRIGVGYRDKGSLRPAHRPVLPNNVSLGSEAIALGFSTPPRWLLNGERKEAAEVLSDWRKDPCGASFIPETSLFYSDEIWNSLVQKTCFPHQSQTESHLPVKSEDLE